MKKLTEAAFQSAAKELGCDVAAIKAVCEVEAPKGGFLPDGRVTILFERHKFHQFTHGIYSKDHPDISNKKPGGYGAEGAHQWDRFDKAAELDSEAAMKSASWGKFQIMGFNYEEAGFDSLDAFVDAMKVSEDEQLKAFVQIVKSFGLVDKLRRHRWAEFALGYNGSNYAINQYDDKLAAAYLKHKADEPELGTVDTPDEPLAENKENVEVPKTQPPPQEITPATAVTVRPSQQSLGSRIAAFAHWIVAGITGLGISLDVLRNKLLGFATDHIIFLILIIFVGIMVIVGSVIWERSKERANQRTLKVADLAADQSKNNVYLGDAK